MEINAQFIKGSITPALRNASTDPSGDNPKLAQAQGPVLDVRSAEKLDHISGGVPGSEGPEGEARDQWRPFPIVLGVHGEAVRQKRS